MLLTVKLLLDWLSDADSLRGKENKMAERLEKAIATVIKEGKVKTYDMGGNSGTLEVAEEVARKF